MPAARKKTTGTSGSVKKSAAPKKRSNRKAAAKASATSSVSPTLVDLVREHLTGQSEPRSAAEITTALEQMHPERTVKTTVVRTTLEGLVAKNQAQRTKQGKSVYYTVPDTAAPADSGEQSV
ncbi:regulatory protein [Streptomyces griseoaurantiacus M045]|uniref:Regulatory protein n=1 Tax=Streptomyces griseoaurantiacus M045 TaxID=996637 RepID=F3NE34_9ACTN|nr:regulatory protein [Streptomyces griseoaurantiacus M045]